MLISCLETQSLAIFNTLVKWESSHACKGAQERRDRHQQQPCSTSKVGEMFYLIAAVTTVKVAFKKKKVLRICATYLIIIDILMLHAHFERRCLICKMIWVRPHVTGFLQCDPVCEAGSSYIVAVFNDFCNLQCYSIIMLPSKHSRIPVLYFAASLSAPVLILLNP